MKTILRTLGILSLATFSCGILLLILIGFTHSLSQFNIVPSAFLPAAETRAVFTNTMSAEDIPWQLFPDTISKAPAAHTTAILRSNDTDYWVVFQEEEHAHAQLRLGRWYVTASDDSILPLLTNQSIRLSAAPAHRLLSQYHSSEPWVYIHPDVTPDSMLFSKGSYISIAKTPNTLTVRATRSSSSHAPISRVIEGTLPGAILTLRHANLRTAYEEMLTTLPTEESVRLRAILEQHILDTFGPTVSLTYDILSLLDAESTLHIGRSASGKLLLALEGTHNERIEHLKNAYSNNQPLALVHEKPLSDRFKQRDIREANTTTQKTFTQNKWNIFGVHDGLHIATNNEQVLIASHKEALLPLIEGHKPLVLPVKKHLQEESLLHAGKLNSNALEIALEKFIGENSLLPQSLNGTSMHWTYTASKDIHTRTLYFE